MRRPASILQIIILLLLILPVSSCHWFGNKFESRWELAPDRVWIGPDYWANRLQDWRLNNGRLECIGNKRPFRTVHLLTRALDSTPGKLRMRIETGMLSDSGRNERAFTGFLIGAGSLQDDYRLRAMIHQAHGKNGGLLAGINGHGKLVLLDNANGRDTLSLKRKEKGSNKTFPGAGVRLNLEITPLENYYKLTLHARDLQTGQTVDSAYTTTIPGDRLEGNIALAASLPGSNGKKSFWYRRWKVQGSKLTTQKKNHFGPIIGVHYTINRGSLRLAAQMAPLSGNNLHSVKLEITRKDKNKWREIARVPVEKPGYTALFDIPDWNSRESWSYRLSYPLGETMYLFRGTIQKEPVNEQLRVAGLHNHLLLPGSVGENCSFTGSHFWYPHQQVTGHIKKHNPHLLVYTGNQVNPGQPVSHDEHELEDPRLDYLYKWFLFCWSQREITKDIPAILLPGPGDYYSNHKPDHANRMSHSLDSSQHPPVSFIKMVHQTQTTHLPETYDPGDHPYGVPSYYTSLDYGGISFAILDGHSRARLPGAQGSEQNQIFGDRQIRFLEEWAGHWAGIHMKAVVTQDPLACLSSTKPSPGEGQSSGIYPMNARQQEPEKLRDKANNGWPPADKNQAVRAIRKAHALIITGGKGPAHVAHHGIDEWDDASYSFALPPMINNNKKGWYLSDTSKAYRRAGTPFTGKFQDGYGNKVTLHAILNPIAANPIETNKNHTGSGYGIILFDKKNQRFTLEAWPADADPKRSSPYPGWPVTLLADENYNSSSSYHLPEILTRGLQDNPVFKVYPADSQELIYGKRATDTLFRPVVFDQSSYTLVVGSPEEGRLDTLQDLEPVSMKKQIILDFRKR